MAFHPQHFGLYFSREHVEVARQHREDPPFEAAWKMLHERAQTGVQHAQWGAIHYRFDDDIIEGEGALKQLMTCARGGFDPDMTFIDALNELLVEAHAFEMLRDHPAMDAATEAEFLGLFEQHFAYLTTLDTEHSYVEALVLTLLKFVAGVVLEREALLQQAIDVYERVIREDIHPQGHIPKAVGAKDGGGLLRQLLTVAVLVLMAEASSLVGFNLWDYSFRGVSLMTAFSYLLYYYYYPDKWRWDPNVTAEPFREYGGFLEIVNRRAYPKDLKPLLDDLRPVYDAPGGGLTTLSHGVARKRGGFK